MPIEVITAIIALIGVLASALCAYAGTRVSANKVTALMEYRLDQLEAKVDKHNNVIERTYKLEAKTSVLEAEVEELRK